MAKLIQICASENDLFGLDGDGVVYHYNFGTNDWIRLGHGRRDRGAVSPVEARPGTGRVDMAEGRSGSQSSGPVRGD